MGEDDVFTPVLLRTLVVVFSGGCEEVSGPSVELNAGGDVVSCIVLGCEADCSQGGLGTVVGCWSGEACVVERGEIFGMEGGCVSKRGG